MTLKTTHMPDPLDGNFDRIEPPLKRMKLLKVSAEMLVELFRLDCMTALHRLGRLPRLHGMPADAKIVNAFWCFDTGCVAFQVVSAEFPEVPECHCLPTLELSASSETPFTVNGKHVLEVAG